MLRGGLVDCEFLVHFLQLRDHVGLTPSLPHAIDALAAKGLVPAELRAAHDAMTRLLVAARLLAPDSQVPPPGPRAALASACQCGDWQCVIDDFAQARGIVAQAWADTFGEPLELDTL